MSRFNARARKLVAASPTLSIHAARGKAFELMPNTMGHYLECRGRLTALGIRPLLFEEL
jgi:hypothetical protein